MMALCNQITQHKCQKHNKTSYFLCIEDICKHPERIMCDSCINLKNTVGLINNFNVFEFLSSKQIEEAANIYQCKANLWQQFKRSQEQIIQMLNTSESIMKVLINSIVGNETIDMIQTQFYGREININDIERLASILNGRVVRDKNGHYNFPEELNLEKQYGYIKSNEILKVCQESMSMLSNILKPLYNTIEFETIKCNEYQTFQTIQLDSSCDWLCFNSNETQIAAAIDKQIFIYNLSDDGSWINKDQPLIGHNDKIQQLQFNHNSTQIASCSYDKLVIIWNKQQDGNWIILDKLDKHAYPVCSICYNHNSKIIASASLDCTVQIHVFKINKWETQQILMDEVDNKVYDVAFNYDSTLLASGNHNQSIIIFECNSQGEWIVKQKLAGHSNPVFRAKFNSNSTQIVSGSLDNSIKIWSVDNQNIWKCNHTLTDHTALIRSVYFNIQSNMIVSSSVDKSIRIWKQKEENKWECTQIINSHKNSARIAILSYDSSMIISGSIDKSIMIHKKYKPQYSKLKQH